MSHDEYGVVKYDWAQGGFAKPRGLMETQLQQMKPTTQNRQPTTKRDKVALCFAGGDVNLYAYAGNDPVNFVDKAGTFVDQISGGASSEQIETLSAAVGVCQHR